MSQIFAYSFYDKMIQILPLCFSRLTRAAASMFLEKQMRNVDIIVSGFEEELAKDATILDQPNALLSRNKQLQVLYFIKQPKKCNNFRIVS